MRLARKQLKIRTAEYDRMANLGVFDADRPHTELLGGLIYETPPAVAGVSIDLDWLLSDLRPDDDEA